MAMVALANSLSVETIAEGTESAAELEVVKRCLCGSAQGFYYAKALSPENFSSWLKSDQQKHSIAGTLSSETI